MSPDDFDFLRKMLRERSGLVLAPEKQYLAESRLLPVARKFNIASLGELVKQIRFAPTSPLAVATVEAMTTNETFFFRDKLPFDHFRDTIVPALTTARDRDKRIRIWCAAASSGQEPYSLALIIKEAMLKQPALAAFRFDILATDLAGEVLERARAGIYTQFEVQRGLPIQLLLKYFSQVGEAWQIAPELRAMVHFRTINLLNDFAPLGRFDVVFCRNVLIYFDQPTKIDVLTRIGRQMPEDGYLALGAAETVVGLTEAFRPLTEKRGLYVPNPAAREREPLAAGATYRRAL